MPISERHGCEVMSMQTKPKRKVIHETPREIIGDKNVMALKQAGFVVVPLSELSQLRANIDSALDILSNEPTRKDRV
jgi:hypothetical protein